MAEKAKIIIEATDKASAKLTKIGKTGESVFKKIAKAMVPLAGVLGFAGLAIGAKRLASSIIESSSKIEIFETRLIAMNKSTEIGKAKLKALSDFATTAPFSTAKVIEAGVTLEAFGLKAEKNIDVLADLAAFMGTDIKEAASAMGRAFAGGAGAADIFRERGILQVIKDSKGIQDLTKLTLPDFREAMIDAFTDPEGKIFGGVNKLKNTFKGSMDTMEGTIFNVKTAIGNALIPTMTELVNKNLIPMIEKAQAWVDQNKELIEQIGTRLVKVMGGAIKIISIFASKMIGLGEIVNRFGLELGLWADASSETAKNQKKLDAQLTKSKNKIQQYTEAWKNALKAEAEGTHVTTSHARAIGGVSQMQASAITITQQSSQELMKLIEAENAHLKVLKEKQVAMLVKKPEDEDIEKIIPGPTPEEVEQRNFALEAIHLNHLERRYALNENEHERELDLLDIRNEEELLKLEEKLIAIQEGTEAHNLILTEMELTKETQELERKALLQRQKDTIDKKAAKQREKDRKKELKELAKFAKVDLELFTKKHKSKTDIFKISAQTMIAINDSMYTAFGQKSKAWFRINQGIAIAQGIMNTYQGATKALAQGGVYGALLAAIVIGAGIAMVAQIAAQKPPAMAEGGIVTGPTTILAGEAGPEKIIPLDQADEEGFGGGVGEGLTINFTGPFLGDPDEAREFAIAVDEELYRLKSEGQSLAFA